MLDYQKKDMELRFVWTNPLNPGKTQRLQNALIPKSALKNLTLLGVPWTREWNRLETIGIWFLFGIATEEIDGRKPELRETLDKTLDTNITQDAQMNRRRRVKSKLFIRRFYLWLWIADRRRKRQNVLLGEEANSPYNYEYTLTHVWYTF